MWWRLVWLRGVVKKTEYIQSYIKIIVNTALREGVEQECQTSGPESACVCVKFSPLDEFRK